MPSSKRSARRSTPTESAGPSLAPGRYFRLLLLGYFEGLDSERAIAWRAADSLSIREFLDFALHEAPPDHSTLSRTRRLIDLETHQAVFTWVLQRLADAHLVPGVHDRDRCDDAGSQRGDAKHRAPGHGRGVRRVADPTGRGLRHRDADARRAGPLRPDTQEEGGERRLDEPARSRREDHEDEGRADASGPYCRARRSTWRRGPLWA